MRFLIYAPLLVVLPGVAAAEPLSFAEAIDRATEQAPSLRARALDIQARQSAAIAATWRLSVPQQPPSTFMFGSLPASST